VDAQAYLQERRALLEPFLDAAVPADSEPPESLHRAMRHLLFPGGKRLRPALAFAGCEALGGSPADALPMAAAVELLHTYSLVHDDLPCMDDDSLRRGRQSVHVAFGETAAVLAGDALQALAFEVLASAAPAADPSVVVGAIAALSRAAGSHFLVGGQLDDLSLAASADAAPGDVDAAAAGDVDAAAARVESIHLRKSAALIAASIAGGARFAPQARPDAVERLHRFGERVGVAFQIADDLIDRDDDEPCSLVPVLGAEGATRRAEELLASALDDLSNLGERAEPLRDLARYAVRRQA